MNIIEIINQIESDKQERKIHPTHATFLEIVRIHGNRDEVSKELNKLYLEDKIKIGNTINDKYILLKS